MASVVIPEVETERLILRGPVPADLDPWTAAVADPDVLRYIPRRRGLTPRERAERLLHGSEQLWELPPPGGFGWVITRKADGQFMGWLQGEPFQEATDCELAYILDKPYWGQGFATEATRAAVRFGFENPGWDRMVAAIMPANVGSRRVLEHLGFVYERDINYGALFGDAPVDLESSITPFFALQRDQFSPSDAYYRVRRAEIS